MIGQSPVKRHNTSSLIGKKIIISVVSLGWNFDVTISAAWTRTPTGIGDWLQQFTLGVPNLECQIILTPQWSG
jgi:hypothetical protein